MASKASRKKAAARRHAHATRGRDIRTESQLNSTALSKPYGDGIAPTAKAVRSGTRTPRPRAAAARVVAVRPTWMGKARRALDILSTAGGVLLREPKPARRP